MSTVVIGALGQLGRDLMARLGSCAIPLGHGEIEITDPGSVAATLDRLQPHTVVNLAAYNLVDLAEDEPERAMAVNAFGPRLLARWCEQHSARLVQVSTDFVFGGDALRTIPWTEDDRPAPVSAYGTSKLAGEYFVRAECSRHLVVRTCGLYGQQPTRGKGNFVETMLRLAAERPELRVVDDQQCTPTSTVDLAEAMARLLATEAAGIVHATNSGSTTWRQFAAEILKQSGIATPVVPIRSSDFAAKARRPAYSVLNCQKLQSLIGWTMPPWDDALSRYLQRRREVQA